MGWMERPFRKGKKLKIGSDERDLLSFPYLARKKKWSNEQRAGEFFLWERWEKKKFYWFSKRWRPYREGESNGKQEGERGRGEEERKNWIFFCFFFSFFFFLSFSFFNWRDKQVEGIPPIEAPSEFLCFPIGRVHWEALILLPFALWTSPLPLRCSQRVAHEQRFMWKWSARKRKEKEKKRKRKKKKEKKKREERNAAPKLLLHPKGPPDRDLLWEI